MTNGFRAGTQATCTGAIQASVEEENISGTSMQRRPMDVRASTDNNHGGNYSVRYTLDLQQQDSAIG
jgi:hypothetical protein